MIEKIKKIKQVLTDFFRNSKITKYLLLFVILLSIPLTILVVKRQQDLRQRAQEIVSPPSPPLPSLSFPFGKALAMNLLQNQNQFVLMRNLNFSLSGPMTLELWIKPLEASSSSSRKDPYPLINWYEPSTGISKLKLSLKKNENNNLFRPDFEMQVIDLNNQTSGSFGMELDPAVANTSIGIDTWSHLSVTISTGDKVCYFSMFVNGKLIHKTQKSFSNGGSCGIPAVSNGSIYIGEGVPAGSLKRYEGMIDELRISSSVRYSNNFIISLVPFKTDGETLALYHFDNNLLDASNYKNHGEGFDQVRFLESDIVSPSPFSISSFLPPSCSPLRTKIEKALGSSIRCNGPNEWEFIGNYNAVADVNKSGSINQNDIDYFNNITKNGTDEQACKDITSNTTNACKTF